MNKKQREEYNNEIENKVKQLQRMKKVAEQVTLTEFIEKYPLHQHIILGSMWYAVNDGVDYSNVSYGGTDPD
jgi:hypothetical protein